MLMHFREDYDTLNVNELELISECALELKIVFWYKKQKEQK